MKKLLSIILIPMALTACSMAPKEEEQTEEPETVTKIVQECVCEEKEEEEEVSANQEVEQEDEEQSGQMPDSEELETDLDNGGLDTNLDDEEVNAPQEGANQESQVSGQPTTYTVVAGDTLTAIADRFGVTATQIQNWNNLGSVDSLYIGQILNILAGNTSTETSSIPNALQQTSDITTQTIDYLLNGQEDKREADRLNWNASFLQYLNIDEVYQSFLSQGGQSTNIEGFAEYLTASAPILENWEEIFKAEFLELHGVEITRLVSIGGDRYRAYVVNDGVEVPEVIVSSRTGHYSR